jgi:hypothetical protein
LNSAGTNIRKAVRQAGTALLAVALTCAALTFVLATPVAEGIPSAAAATCVSPVKGEWSGLWSSSIRSGPGYNGLVYGRLTFTPTATAGSFTVGGSVKVLGSAVTIGGRVSGTVTCGAVQFGLVSGPISVSFTGMINSDGVSGSGTYSEVDGTRSDSGTWSAAIVTISVTPSTGLPGTSVTVASTGGPFEPGETVSVTYATRLVSPKLVTLCTATADFVTGGMSCSGSIPTDATHGPLGKHSITASGTSTRIKAKTTFSLT